MMLRRLLLTLAVLVAAAACSWSERQDGDRVQAQSSPSDPAISATPTATLTSASSTPTMEWTPTEEVITASPLTTWDPNQVEAFNQASVGPGTLEISDECVLLVLEHGWKVLPVWPEPTGWNAANQSIEYVSPFGGEQTQLQAGDRITFGGSTKTESFALYIMRPTAECEAQAESAFIVSEVRVEPE